MTRLQLRCASADDDNDSCRARRLAAASSGILVVPLLMLLLLVDDVTASSSRSAFQPTPPTMDSVAGATARSLDRRRRYRSSAAAVRSPSTSSLSMSSLDPDSYEMDDEWHPRDPAYTTPQLLCGLWHQIAAAGSMSKGVRS